MPWGRFGFERDLSGITFDSLRGSGGVRVARDIEDSETRRGCFDFGRMERVDDDAVVRIVRISSVECACV